MKILQGELINAPQARVFGWICTSLLGLVVLLVTVPGDVCAQANVAAQQQVRSEALVVLKADTFAEMRESIKDLEGMGVRVLHVFPPRALICSLPIEIEPTLLAHRNVQACHRRPLPAPDAGVPLASIRSGVLAWNRITMPPSILASRRGPPGQPLVGDSFPHPSTDTPGAIKSAGPTAMDSPLPGPSQTSEFMIGKVAVGIIMPESAGNGENWITSRQDQVIQEITAGCNWWATTGGAGARLTFYYDIHRSVPTQYEPIQRPRSDEGLWIGETLTNLGYVGSSYWTQCGNYDNAIRNQFHSDWAFTIFVVDSLNDADGKFSDDTYFAYAYVGGPFLLMTYSNDGWGINRMDLVTSHEVGHIFGAGDEYCDQGYFCCDFGYYGYLNVYNGNCELDNPSSIDCLMKRNSQVLCDYTRGQIGWRDLDHDGLFDPTDTAVSVTLSPVSGASASAFTGTAMDVAYPSPTRSSCTMNTIATVEYRVDSGTWVAATPTDGTFNSAQESYSFTVCPGPGAHTVESRARNSVGNLGTQTISWTVPSDVIYVDRSYAGPTPSGSICAPFRTVTQGYQTAQNGNTIRIFTGNYAEELRMDKTLRLESTTGLVRIGP